MHTVTAEKIDFFRQTKKASQVGTRIHKVCNSIFFCSCSQKAVLKI